MTTKNTSTASVVSVNISTEKGTVKTPVPEIQINNLGIVNDAHAGAWHRQVSLLAKEHIDIFAAQSGREMKWGEFAENITTQGIDLGQVALFDRFLIGDTALEVSQIGKKCHGSNCAIFQEVGNCVMPKEGIFCRVIQGGTIRPDDAIQYQPRPLAIRIITMSDRAHNGEYEDRSGPKLKALLDAFFEGTRWHTDIQINVLPDEIDLLQTELISYRDADIHAVFITGGTGIGPRDITPEAVRAVADKEIPGIMDHIRAKYGSEKPNALLSRSVAAIAGNTLIYALPGSVKAVEEYMHELLKTFEHLLFMLNGIDTH